MKSKCTSQLHLHGLKIIQLQDQRDMLPCKQKDAGRLQGAREINQSHPDHPATTHPPLLHTEHTGDAV